MQCWKQWREDFPDEPVPVPTDIQSMCDTEGSQSPRLASPDANPTIQLYESVRETIPETEEIIFKENHIQTPESQKNLKQEERSSNQSQNTQVTISATEAL